MGQPTGATPADVDTATVDDDDAVAQDLLADAVADDAGADQLGDAGKKALDAMKARWRSERDRARSLQSQIDALNKPKPDEQPDPERIRKQARAEAQAEVLKERALDRIEAKAAKLFADPEDARALLASQVDDFVDDGKVDTDAIMAALDDLLSKKPHLAAQSGKRFGGSADGGARNGKTGPAQLTQADVDRLWSEGKHQEIEKARIEGRLTELMSGKK